ncbi:MerR family transcriptional regulator [Canibacter sp. lx-45]|uniref:transcriptional regulator FtsR n=1 Tax=Canibacter zhuwentaonis TaxID=2837491 RepID=UPI001BDCF949|nr:MerR family transcriptional regulator [Canibacter zhuwentaonis]
MRALNTAALSSKAKNARFSIGQVLEALSDNFADLTASKIRFLEDRGLITPERSNSGYRKYTQADIERLRLILTLQAEHFLPLKAILELLKDIDAGKDPVIPGAAAPQDAVSIFSPHKVLTRDELATATGVSQALIRDAIRAGILPGAEVFPAVTVNLVNALGRLAEHGITPRHLQSTRVAAEKQAADISHIVRSRGGVNGVHEHYEQALQIAELFETVRISVVRNALRR